MAQKKKPKKGPVKSKKEVSKKSKEEKEPTVNSQENKILKLIFLTVVFVLIIMAGMYFYVQDQSIFHYKNIEFGKNKIGDITFYETKTLSTANDGTLFGFRLRTRPSVLENIPFKNVEDLKLLKFNGYNYEKNKSFNCEGNGIIAMANLQRLFEKQGMNLIRDPNSTCDPEGRYNYFNIKYGDSTQIKEVGPNCYDIIISGDDNQCQILQATEKLMVEAYSRYLTIKDKNSKN